MKKKLELFINVFTYFNGSVILATTITDRMPFYATTSTSIHLQAFLSEYGISNCIPFFRAFQVTAMTSS